MLRRLNPVRYVKQKIANAYQRKVDNVKAKMDAFTIVPVRFQGTFVEHWARYWKFLVKDYFTVIWGIVKDAKNRPMRALIIYGTGGVVYQLNTMNPTDEDFQAELRHSANEVGSLPETMQNPVARDHIISLERLNATGELRRLNLGVASIFWRHDHNEELKMYKANCKYLSPDWLAFNERIVDIGFMNRLWILHDRMKDYDVNNSEIL